MELRECLSQPVGQTRLPARQAFLFVHYGQTGMSDPPVVVKIGCSIVAGKNEVPQKNKGRETDNPLV
jgi:hypothetical protein